MAGQAHRWLIALVIVIPLSGCDNVEWGGVDWQLVPPPPGQFAPAADTVAEDGGEILLPEGPVLYMGMRDSAGIRIVPVAEITGDSLVAFPSEEEQPGFRSAFAREFLGEGARFTLFAEGVRVGTLIGSDVETDNSFCVPRPSVRGTVELITDAAEVRRFLAVPEGAVGVGHTPFRAPEHDRAQRTAGLEMAAEMIPQVGAQWPTDLVAARGDMQALTLGPGGPNAFTATFVFRDGMTTGAPREGTWAMFILGIQDGTEYRPGFAWYRDAGRDGKGIPVLWEHFDWDRDGETELLLEVLGEGTRWNAAVGVIDGEWQRIWQEPCGRRAPATTAAADDGEG